MGLTSCTINGVEFSSTSAPTFSTGDNNSFAFGGTDLPTGLQNGSITWNLGYGTLTTNAIEINTSTIISGKVTYTAPEGYGKPQSTSLSISVSGSGSFPSSGTYTVKVPPA